MQQCHLEPGVDRILKEGARLAGVDAQEMARAGWALLAPEHGPAGRRGGFSELNNDGSPVQLCLSQSRKGTGLRLLVDPAWYLVDAPLRLSTSRLALADALERGSCVELSAPCHALLCALLLDEGPALQAYPSSLLWLGVGLGQPGCALYVDTRPLGESVWERCELWLEQVLADAGPARSTLSGLKPYAQISSVGLEGVSLRHARAKLYWRLKAPTPLSTLGLPLLNDAALGTFLATALGTHAFPLSGLVMSAGFDLRTGALEDVKIDLCGHCLPQPCDDWLRLIEQSSAGLGFAPPPVNAALRSGQCDVAFLGAGLDRHGHHRLNVYLKPAPPSCQPADTEALRERMASACAYLCRLQTAEGGFADYRLPVGESNQWVCAFVALALALAAEAADLPWARAAAERAADWLLEQRSYDAGWGYNDSTGTDADSTGFAIRLLRATGRKVPDQDQLLLRRHWLAQGGFATYDGPQAWGHAHPCVTAAAYLALDDATQQELLPALRSYLQSTGLDGETQPAYWWRTHHYSTWHHLLLERRLEGAAPSRQRTTPTPQPEAPLSDAFEMAYAAGIAHFRAPGSLTARQLLGDLLAAQRVDGGWTGGFNLRVTEPSCERPWERPEGDLYRDLAGSITTASALFVLTEMLHA